MKKLKAARRGTRTSNNHNRSRRNLRPERLKKETDVESVLLVFVNSCDVVRTFPALRRVGTGPLLGQSAVHVDSFVDAGYELIGLVVLPLPQDLGRHVDSAGRLQWPVEVFRSHRTKEESNALVEFVASEVLPSIYPIHRQTDEQTGVITQNESGAVN
jgi:hypothetical protein